MFRNTAISDPTSKSLTWSQNLRLAPSFTFWMRKRTPFPLLPLHPRLRVDRMLPKMRKKSISFPMTSISSHWSKNSPSDITARTCNIGQELWWEICAERMILEVELDSVHTINVESGRSILGSLQNVEGAGGQSTAVRSAKRVHGYSIVIGVLQHLSNALIAVWYSTKLASWLKSKNNEF